MIGRLWAIAYNTYREAVRDRVLYNLILFALLIVGSSVIFGQISLEINRIVLINLGLTAISLFGIVIAIFIGIGLVSKEIEKKTLYTVLAARPVRRWEFITGKFLGLVMTLTVNALLMSVGFFAARALCLAPAWPRRSAAGHGGLFHPPGICDDHRPGAPVLHLFHPGILLHLRLRHLRHRHLWRRSARTLPA